MKWIFALNAESVDSYGDFARVAVWSARRHSSLEAVCLFDGEPCDFTDWLEGRGVEVVQARSRFYEAIGEVARRRNNPGLFRTGAGAFLRLEIPRVAQELGWSDEFVFYTDCDVIFQSDPRPLLEGLTPRVFAAAPETFREKPLHMNTGAMWLRVAALADPQLEVWTRANLERCLAASFDQGALRVFYNLLHRRAWRLGVPDKLFYAVMSRVPLRTWQWDDLPLELNWKPYWGENPAASVIHFHGLKPTYRAVTAQAKLPPYMAVMHTPFWEECAARWDALLLEAKT